MFDLNPLNLPDVLLQHGLMLLVAATLGFLIGYSSRRGLIAQLEGQLGGIERDLDDCRRAPVRNAATEQEMLILNRIRARAGEVDLRRIGVASAGEADDLKEIVGVGPFLERKLHTIGIYTFRQIANFTKSDVDKVNDIIEFFPGRIERDDWVGQAMELERKKRL